MSKHRKGKMPCREVACQIIWNSIPPYVKDRALNNTEYTSPFFFFKNEAAMKKWQKEARKIYPGIKFKTHMANWTPELAIMNLEYREASYAGANS